MTYRNAISISAIAILAIGGLNRNPARAQTVIVDETFESYTSEAELHEVWAGLEGSSSPGSPAEVEEQFELTSLTAPNADFNGNSVVDAADYVIWRNNLGLTGTATQEQGDANGDMNVDAADYDAWAQNYGTTPMTGSSGQALHHLSNSPDETVPDGNVVYQPPLDPNYEPDNSIFPSDGLEPIVLGGDIYLDTAIIQRNTIGLRSFFDGLNRNFFEMGVYNAASSQPGMAENGAAVDGSDGQSHAFAGLGVRMALFEATPGPIPEWQFFAFDPSWDSNENGLVTLSEVFGALGGPGWHRLEATISADPETDGHNVEVTIDLLRDGLNNATGEEGVDGTLTFEDMVTVWPEGFNSLRLGGPSGGYSTQAAFFDNIYLSAPLVEPLGAASAVPEPSAALLSILAAVGLVGRRRW